jgi:hypothetical protein
MLSLITQRSTRRYHRERPISVHATTQRRQPPTLKTLHTQSPDQLKQRSENSKDSGLDQALYEWAQARTKAMTVDLQRLDENPRATDTVLLPPWRTVLVPQARIDALKSYVYHYCSPSIWMWNIGYGRPVANCNPYDINPTAIDQERSTRRPGQGRFQDVARGAYGNRNFKYLWAIDHRGMHIAREMTPCKLSSRGVLTHSILVDQAILGGEIFFDPDDPEKVLVNFGSARLPPRDVREMEHTAEFLLALDYRTVIAMIPNRDLQQHPYGMSDRYGPQVQNMVFRCEE